MLSETDILALLPPPIAVRAKSASFDNGVVTLVLDAGGLNVADRAGLEKAAQTVLNEHPHIADTRVAMMSDKVKRRVVAIASGKGGVGKSTLTANLAVALKAAGHKVGVVDADVYGPSQPTLLNSKDAKPKAHNEQLIPVAGHSDIPMLSMGHLVDADKALAWRGPMAAGALTQLMEADWGETELLLLDLPPGTGDVQLTMVQKFKPDGAVIVSTPQDLALMDAKRAMQLFAQVQVPIIGLVENMSGYVCPHCGEASDPFGAGGVEHAAQTMGAEFLGRIPLALGIREASDAGSPAVEHADFAPHYMAIAEQVQAWLDRELD